MWIRYYLLLYINNFINLIKLLYLFIKNKHFLIKATFLTPGGELGCNSCTENGICEGGYIPIYPKDNYGRID